MPDVPASSVCRIYVSAITQLNLRIATTAFRSPDTPAVAADRADAATRGCSAAETLAALGLGAARGAAAHLPFTENSDAIFQLVAGARACPREPARRSRFRCCRSGRDSASLRRGEPAALVSAVVPPGANRCRARQLDPSRVRRRIDSRKLSTQAGLAPRSARAEVRSAARGRGSPGCLREDALRTALHGRAFAWLRAGRGDRSARACPACPQRLDRAGRRPR